MRTKYLLVFLSILYLINVRTVFAQSSCKGTSNVANFSAGTPACEGQALTFTISSPNTDNPTYIWRWGDSNVEAPSAATTATHTYATSGSKSVTLVRIYTSPACRDSVTKVITINALPPVPAFTFLPATPCGQAATTFTVTTPVAGTTYTWNFGDAASGSSNSVTGTSVSHAFTPTGATGSTYNVVLTATRNGCSTAAPAVAVPIKATPLISATTLGVNASNFRRCLNASAAETQFTFTFRNNSTSVNPTTYTWSWGDATPNTVTNTLSPDITHQYNIGVYTFTLTALDNVTSCTSTFTRQVVYEKDPSGAIIIPANLVTLCEGDTMRVTFQTQNATSYTLYWADGDSLNTTSTGPHKHVYNFSAAERCTVPASAATGYNRFMRLISRNNCNTQEALSQFRTQLKPKPNFTVPANLCLSGGTRTVAFTNTSCPSDAQANYTDPIAQYDWNFGDPASGAANTLQTFFLADAVSHTYSAAGTYNVKLTATNGCGARDTTIQVVVGTQTTASFNSGINGSTAVNTCSGTPIDLTPAAGLCLPIKLPLTSTSTGGGNLSWAVSGGAGFTFNSTNSTNSSSAIDTIRFTQPGTYNITLTSSNSCGAPATSCATITIKGKPTPTAAAIGGLSAFQQPPTAQFPSGYFASCGATAISPSTTQNTGETYSWSVVGTNGTPNPAGNTGTGINPNFNLPVGQYNINLTPTNSCGAAAQPATVPFIVTNPPTAVASTAPRPTPSQPKQVKVCPSVSVNLGTGTAVTNVNYAWTVNGGGAAPANNTSLTTTVTNSTAGTYQYILTATDQTSNCQKKDTLQIVVNLLPAIQIGGDATKDTTVCKSTVPFAMKATPIGGGWKGQGGIAANGNFTPNTVGTFAIRYGVTNANGCTDTLTANITVIAPPIITFSGNFTYCNTSNPEPLPTATGNVAGTGVWSCPSAPTAISGTPQEINASIALGALTPPQDVLIRYTFTALASPNCVTVKDTLIRIIGSPTAEAGSNRTVCADAAPFLIAGTPAGGTWAGTGVAADGTFTPSSVLPNPLTGYKLTYTIGTGSCSASDTMRVFVKPLPVIADSVLTPVAVCIDKAPYFLTDHKRDNGNVTWSGTGLPTGFLTFDNTANLYEIDPSKGVAGTTYTLTYTYTSATGTAPFCKQTKTKAITVNPLPVVTVQAATFCKNSAPVTMPNFSPTLSAGGTGVWTNVTSPVPTPNITVNANGTFAPNQIGTFTLRYTFTDNNGCVAFKETTVVISEPTTVQAGNDTTICVSNPPFTLDNFTPAGGQWTGTGITNPSGTFDPATSGVGVFNLTYTTNPGDPLCERLDTRKVTVKALPVIVDTAAAARTPAEVCIDKPKYVLSDYKRANGTGIWSGTSLPTGLLTFNALQNVYEFDPSKGIGGTTYTLTYTYTQSGALPQCSNSKTKTIKINPLPVVVARDTTFCRSITSTLVNLANFSPTTGGTGVWTNVTSPVPTPNITLNANGSFIPNALGTFTFRYTFTDVVTSCVNFKDISVVISEPVVVNAGNDLVMCIDTSVTSFTLPSFSPAGGTWAGAGVTAAGVFTPRNAGPRTANINGTTYTLTYTVGTGLCLRQDAITVRVKPLPSVNAGASQDTICYLDVPFNLSALAGVTPPSPAGVWSGTGVTNSTLGTFNPRTAVGTTAPTAPQTFTISYNFRSVNNCDSTHTKTIVVNPMPIAKFDTLSPRAVYCVGTPYTFQNNTLVPAGSSTMTYLWDFGDGVLRPSLANGNGQFTFTTTGNKNITLYAKSEKTCWDTLTLPIRVVQPAVPNFTFNKPVVSVDSCGPKTVTFTNTTTGFEPAYQWNFGNGITSSAQVPPSVTYLPSKFRDTTYYITLTTPNLCGSPIKRDSITIKPQPTAGFSYDKIICAGFPLTISNTSFGKATKYEWTFSDAPGTVVTTFPVNPPAQNQVIHAFNYTGKDDTTYVIRLIASNVCGSDTLIDSIKVKAKEVKALFGLGNDSVGCAPYTITLTSNQPQGTSNALTWFWGDGNTTSGGNVQTHTFNNPGVYKVRFAVVNGCNQDTITRNIRVKPKPIASFSVNKVNTCKGDTIRFTNNSSSPSGAPLKYLWDFGDGTTSTQNPPPFKVYTTAATYTVTLTVSENLAAGVVACDKVATQTVVIRPDTIVKAKMKIDTTFGCAGLPVTFTNQTAGNNNFVIFAGDGRISTTSPVTFIYNTPGVYDAYIKVVGTCNADSTVKVPIRITQSPLAAFMLSKDSICLGDTVKFVNTTPNQGSLKFEWKFGDNTSSLLNAPPAKVYTAAGDYTITLKAISFAVAGVPSCTTTIQKVFKVKAPPKSIIQYAPLSICQGQSILFDGSNSLNANNYLWDFGVGGAGSVNMVQPFTYPVSGFFKVKLKTRNSVGCESIDSVNVSVSPKAAPDFLRSDTVGCSPLTVNFTNISPYPTILQGVLNWNFGNGNTFNGFTGVPPQTYINNTNAPITFTVKLVATTNFFCKDSITKIIVVYPTPKANFEIQPKDTLLQSNATFTFVNTTTPTGNWQYIWTYGDGSKNDTVNTTASVSHTYDSLGTYPVTLIAVSDKGCSTLITKPVTILPVLPEANFATIGDTAGCSPFVVNVQNVSKYGQTFRWDFGNFVRYDLKNPPPVTYYEPGTYTIRLIAKNPTGEDTIIKTKVITVYERPIAAFKVNPRTVILPNKILRTINISRGDTAKAQYFWDFGDSTAVVQGYEPTHLYKKEGIYTIKMVMVSQFGCTDTTIIDSAVTATTGGILVVPNAFTPRGGNLVSPNELNDVFLPLTDGATKYSLKIFSRWGELLFESNDPAKGWDGYHRGQLCTQDVYVYKVEVTFADGTKRTKVGDVTLIR